MEAALDFFIVYAIFFTIINHLLFIVDICKVRTIKDDLRSVMENFQDELDLSMRNIVKEINASVYDLKMAS